MTQKFKQSIALSIIGTSIIFSGEAYADRVDPYMPSYEDLLPSPPPDINPNTPQQPEVLELPDFPTDPIFEAPDYSDMDKCLKDAGDAYAQCLGNGGEYEDCNESMEWVVKNICTPLMPPLFPDDLMP
jgi:hypothetical protein